MDFIHNGVDIPDAPPKDPDADGCYGVLWDQWLREGEVITHSEWLLPPELSRAIDPDTGFDVPDILTADVTGITIAGGTEFNTYLITNRIRTNMNLKDDRSMKIFCRNK